MRVRKLSISKLSKLNNKGVVRVDVYLKNLTTFKVGGKVKYYIEICTLENFIKVMEYLKTCNIQVFILGNGSNILSSDKGFDGLIIKLKGDFDRISHKDNFMEVGCGVLLSKAYSYAVNNELAGLEEGGCIPASIGGAIYMNCSAGDFEMGSLVEYVIAYNYDKILYLRRDECKFSYRHSIFQEGKYIILRVGLRLQKDDKQSIIDRYSTSLQKRKNSQPLEYPSAGCVFKRIDNLNISKMLDDMGIKGLNIGGAVVSDKHANFIISKNATASDIKKLIDIIKDKFYKKYNIELKEEIIYLGDFDET